MTHTQDNDKTIRQRQGGQQWILIEEVLWHFFLQVPIHVFPQQRQSLSWPVSLLASNLLVNKRRSEEQDQSSQCSNSKHWDGVSTKV